MTCPNGVVTSIFFIKSLHILLLFTTSKSFFSYILRIKSPQTSSLSHESLVHVQPQSCGLSLFTIQLSLFVQKPGL